MQDVHSIINGMICSGLPDVLSAARWAVAYKHQHLLPTSRHMTVTNAVASWGIPAVVESGTQCSTQST